MNSEIENMVKRFPTCLTFGTRQPSEPIINHQIPNQAQTKIAVDPFRLYEHYYLLIIDYYFKFIVIETLKKLQSSTVINKCKKVLSQFGTPKELVTDNGPEFSSHYFKSFSRTWDFEHQIIRPHFHQSNALVERTTQTIKRTLKKAKFYFLIPNLTNVDRRQLISYSITQFARIYSLVNHNLNLLPPIQQLNQIPRIVYQT